MWHYKKEINTFYGLNLCNWDYGIFRDVPNISETSRLLAKRNLGQMINSRHNGNNLESLSINMLNWEKDPQRVNLY